MIVNILARTTAQTAILFILIAICALPCAASVRATRTSPSPPVEYNYNSNGPHDVVLPGPPTGSTWTYVVEGFSDNRIRLLQIGDTSNPLSGTVNLTVIPCTTGGCGTVGHGDVDEIIKSGNGTLNVDEITINGDLGLVVANSVGQVTVGDVIGSITTTSAGITGPVIANRGIKGGGGLYAQAGNIGNIATSASAQGDIGEPGLLANIYATGSIGLIDCNGDLYANIDPNTSTNGVVDGTINKIDVSGNFDGTIQYGTHTQDVLYIGLDCYGTIKQASSLGSSGGRQILIGSSLGHVNDNQTIDPGLIEIFSDPSQGGGINGGQIVINYNKPSPDGEWMGEVRVGPSGSAIVLSGDEWSQTAGAIGGGSVGLVKYRIHGASSTIHDNDTFTAGNSSAGGGVPATPTIRMYGPVIWYSTVADPFRLDQRPQSPANSTWTQVDPSCYSTTTTIGQFGVRNITMDLSSVGFQRTMEYRIRPLTSTTADAENQVRCDVGRGNSNPALNNNPSVADDDLRFKVGSTFQADFNADGCVNGADLSVLLSAFGTTYSSSSCGYTSGNPGDANYDGNVNGADLSVFLGTFGQGECEMLLGGGGDSLMSGSGPSSLEIVACFGQESLEEYATWAATMDAEEFADHVVVLQAVIEALRNNEQ